MNSAVLIHRCKKGWMRGWLVRDEEIVGLKQNRPQTIQNWQKEKMRITQGVLGKEYKD